MELHPSLKGEKLERLKLSQEKMTIMFEHFNLICRKYNIEYWAIATINVALKILALLPTPEYDLDQKHAS